MAWQLGFKEAPQMQGATPDHGGPRDGIRVCTAGRGGRACELGQLTWLSEAGRQIV